jgi:hypothetical protein
MRHVKKNHPDKLGKLMMNDHNYNTESDTYSQHPSSSSSFSSKSSDLSQQIQTFRDEEYCDAIANCFADCSLPLVLVEHPSFVHFMSVHRKCQVPLPTRKSLKPLQRNLALRSTDFAIEKAARSALPSSLALMVWYTFLNICQNGFTLWSTK